MALAAGFYFDDAQRHGEFFLLKQGSAADEIVAGWRGGEGGVTLYGAMDEEEGFRTIPINRGIAVEGAAAADINLDGQLHLVALGGRTNNLVWHEKRSL